jgi:hypothetical protein
LKNFLNFADDIVDKLKANKTTSMTPKDFEVFIKKIVGNRATG